MMLWFGDCFAQALSQHMIGEESFLNTANNLMWSNVDSQGGICVSNHGSTSKFAQTGQANIAGTAGMVAAMYQSVKCCSSRLGSRPL